MHVEVVYFRQDPPHRTIPTAHQDAEWIKVPEETQTAEQTDATIVTKPDIFSARLMGKVSCQHEPDISLTKATAFGLRGQS